MEIIIYIIVGIIIGAVCGFLIAKSQRGGLEAKTASLLSENDRLSSENTQLKEELTTSNQNYQSLSTKYEVLLANKENIEKQAKDELQKANQEKVELQEAFQKQLNEVNKTHEKNCQEIKENLASQQKQQQESYQRELDVKTAEHDKSVEVIKEHQAKEIATLKASFEESKRNWQSEKQTMLDNKQQILDAKEDECQKALAVLKARYEQENANLKAAAEEASKNWQSEKLALESHSKELFDAKDEEYKNAIAAQEKRHNEAIEALKVTFNQTIENLKANMTAATEDILKNRQKEFSDISQKNIKGIVDPLNETIEKMKQAMEGYSKEQSEFSGTMKTNIDTIIKQTETARQSAVELTTALKHDTKVQGDYGEAILDEILSKQGFTEGVHYELQYVMRDEAGRALKDEEGVGLRPDVIFHIDTVRDVIIDSKTNLTEFILFANAQTPEERKEHLEKHVKAIETQVKLLSQKNYFKYHKKTSSRMDYVIMFVPISAAWWEALRYKPSLWREAMDNNVYIADEQTLFAALRIIKLTWTQIAQVNSQKEIFELVNEMVDRVGQFIKSYKAIGEALGKAQTAYNDGEKKLAPGGYSILTTTTKILKKGGQDSKKNPVGKFLDIDDVEQLPDPVALPEFTEEPIPSILC